MITCFPTDMPIWDENTGCFPTRVPNDNANEWLKDIIINTQKPSEVQLPLKSQKLNVKIDGLGIDLVVEQEYKNPLPTVMDMTYTFPIPPRGYVTEAKASFDGRVVKAVLKERSQARQEYLQATQAGHTAALVEADRGDVLTLVLGQVPSGQVIKVTLTIHMSGVMVGGKARAELPLTLAPKYSPGKAQTLGEGTFKTTGTTEVPDAGRLTPPRRNKGQDSALVDLDVTFQGNVNPECASHTGYEVKKTTKGSKLSLRRVLADRDIILEWENKQETQVRWVADDPKDKSENALGTLEVTITPLEAGKVLPVDLAVILDRSGSMGGWKMLAARRAASRMVDSLGENDRFWVCAFDHSVDIPKISEHGLVEASDKNRFEAVTFLGNLEARGSTEIMKPLNIAAGALNGQDKGRDRVIVLVTDGQVGNEHQLANLIKSELKGVRMLVVGVDEAAAHGVLGKLAQGGKFEAVESPERLDEVLIRLGREIKQPASRNLRLRSDVEFEALTPSGTLDTYKGATTRIHARCENPGNITLFQDGTRGGVKLDVTTSLDPSIRTRWAGAWLNQLDDRVQLGDSDAQEESLAVSLRYKVICRQTAFIAVDEKGDLVPGSANMITQAHEDVHGWNMAGGSFMGVLRGATVMQASAISSQGGVLMNSIGAPSVTLNSADPFYGSSSLMASAAPPAFMGISTNAAPAGMRSRKATPVNVEALLAVSAPLMKQDKDWDAFKQTGLKLVSELIETLKDGKAISDKQWLNLESLLDELVVRKELPEAREGAREALDEFGQTDTPGTRTTLLEALETLGVAFS